MLTLDNILLCLLYQTIILLIVLYFKIVGGREWGLLAGKELRNKRRPIRYN